MFLISAKNRQQRTIIAVLAVYLCFLVLSVATRSSKRSSILASVTGSGDVGGDRNSDKEYFEVDEGGAKLTLQDFRRSEIRRGKPVWDVVAKEATYLAREGVTHVNDAALRIFRSPRSIVDVQSRQANLYMVQQSIARAELQGDIVLSFDNLQVNADFVVYNAKDRTMNSPGLVKINGEGFEVSGLGFSFDLDEQVIKLSHQVVSSFSSIAKVPRGLKKVQNGI